MSILKTGHFKLYTVILRHLDLILSLKPVSKRVSNVLLNFLNIVHLHYSLHWEYGHVHPVTHVTVLTANIQLEIINCS
jgi:hypothetical protein